ncbi:MAG: C39 family peptidase [Acidobacteria bacterium]|nr:C39 family peptidase [Acidobacteriota bacterium]
MRAAGSALVALAVATGSAVSAAGIRLLDVPFVSQSEALCGGAAAAMVLRYWGERGVSAEDFSDLVDRSAGGIASEALVEALRGRGWTALPFQGDRALLREHLERGRPVIALIGVGPARFHYVVIVGLPEGAVVVHDPALAPFHVFTDEEFAVAWQASWNWALLVLPPGPAPAPGEPRPTAPEAPDIAPGDPCDGMVAAAVARAKGGDAAAARQALEAAVGLCPDSPAAARELAGLRFVEKDYAAAEHLAARAVALAPGDAHAWRTLATSRFVLGDAAGALAAWNHVGEPRVDLTQVEGLVRTPHRVVEELVAVAPRATLTPAALRRAGRRVALLPAQDGSRVDYRPLPGGWAEVRARVHEAPLVPDRWTLVGRGLRALVERELLLDAAGLARGGERVALAYRFWHDRPRVALRVAAPRLFGRSGLWRVDAAWEEQPYRLGAGEPFTESRRGAALAFGDWFAADTYAEIGAGYDRWRDRGGSAALAAAVEQRLAADRLALRVEGGLWREFHRLALGAAWRSSAEDTPWSAAAVAGWERAARSAPLDLWPGAGAGHAREPLLRAHPLLDGGVIDGPAFGPRLAHASFELRRSLARKPIVGIDAAAFADAARAWHGPAGDRRTHVDVGLGLRLRVVGVPGALRLDFAHGLRDGADAFSAAWQLPWDQPGRLSP